MKSMIKPQLIWSLTLTLPADFHSMLHLMKRNGGVGIKWEKFNPKNI